MDEYENLFSPTGAPLFDGSNYECWSIMRRLYLQTQGCCILESILNGYIAPKIPPKNGSKKELRKNNAMEMYTILHGIFGSVKVKVGNYTLAKELWDKLQNIYTNESLH